MKQRWYSVEAQKRHEEAIRQSIQLGRQIEAWRKRRGYTEATVPTGSGAIETTAGTEVIGTAFRK